MEDLYSLEPLTALSQMNNHYFPPYITLAHVFNAPELWGIKTRTLSQYQLQYVIKGVAEYTIENQTFLTRNGDLIYHLPHKKHSVRTFPGEPYLCISLVFHFGLQPFPIAQFLGESRYIGNFTEFPLEMNLSKLVTLHHQPDPHYALACQSLLLQTIHDLYQWRNQSSQTQGQEKTKGKVILLRNHILKHYDRDLDHNELEKVTGLSRNYIIVKFRALYGMTPFEYLTSVRVSKAKEMVIQTTLSVTEIARLVGYSDVHTFGRMFKKKTGSSISQFCSSLVQ
ncbi:MAG: AraC family transcriptional regulator [Paenibacillus sp.]|nr:AraC family transcriptional regulator [Paenibacillus sp.]